MVYFLASYLLVTPSLALGTLIYLLHRLFHGAPARQFLKDLLFVLFEAPLWVASGVVCWVLVAVLGTLPPTRLAGWIVMLSCAIACNLYVLIMAGTTDALSSMIVVFPAVAGIAIGVWQFLKIVRV